MSQPSLNPVTSSVTGDAVFPVLEAAVGNADGVTLAFDGPRGRLSRRAALMEVTPQYIKFAVGASDASLLADAAAREGAATVITALRVGGNEVVFFSKLIGLDPAASVAGDDSVDVMLALPGEVIATRRRRSFRIAVTAEDQIQLRMWRIDEYTVLRDCPKPSRAFRAELYDLSASGLRAVLYARPVEAMQLQAGQRFRVEIIDGDQEMIFEARLRHPRESDRDDVIAFCGFEFVDRNHEIEGRRYQQRLDALLARLQRAAARRQSAAA